MTEAADLIEALIAYSVPASLIAQVAQLATEAASLRRRLARDATRQREARQRKRHVMSQESRDVTRRHVTPPKVPPTPPLITPSRSEPKKVLRSMPIDWSPSLEVAEKRGWPRERAISEAQRFKDFAEANGKRYANWDAAWRNWVTSPYQTAKGNGHGSTATNGLARALAKLDDSIGQAGRSEAPCEDDVRLFSDRGRE